MGPRSPRSLNTLRRLGRSTRAYKNARTDDGSSDDRSGVAEEGSAAHVRHPSVLHDLILTHSTRGGVTGAASF